ncbi:alpha/beta hydrolase [Marinimicrobium sp. LS-A18]|uniref:alpha/beta hydrolase n=1 Tax=Marinimicrobium sp. LS-A18 TaxID=1381596 RepID=UPI000466199A|nr:alpha/beta hydrolase [Marinimicrobium sp. LS-A18]
MFMQQRKFGYRWFALLLPALLSVIGFALAADDKPQAGKVGALSSSGTELEFSDCALTANERLRHVQCARLSVPENYEQQGPDDVWIDLLIVRLPATAAQVQDDPVLAIAGGPGQAASRSFLRLDRAFAQLARRRDIYLVDQRGTGQSSPQPCAVDDAAMPLADPDPAQLSSLARACLQDFNGDPRHYTTEVAVRDLERVRQALGVSRWNLYGVSYGTRVAQTYMRRYPDAVRTAVLDGVLPADVSLGPQIAGHSQAALDALIRQCDQSSPCRERFPELQRDITELLDRLESEPVEVRYESLRDGSWQTLRFTRAHLVNVIRMALYNSDVLSVLPPMIDSAARDNNLVALARLAQRLDISDDIALGMHNSVVCTEDAPFYPQIGAEEGEGTYMGPGFLAGLKAMCEPWPRGEMGEHFKAPLKSDIPTLLLSGERDPITPPAYGDQLMQTLGNARHLVVPERGHQVGLLGCVPDIIARFVISAEPGSLSADCLDRVQTVPLFLDRNGPSP